MKTYEQTPENIEKENFILAFQINNDELLDGLIEYHKNNSNILYKYSVFYDFI